MPDDERSRDRDEAQTAGRRDISARIPQMDRRSVGVVRRFRQPFQSLTVNQRAEHVGRDG